MGRKSRSRSRGAEPPSPPDVGPPLAGGQDHRAADGIDIVDELFGDLGRVRELTDAIVIAPPGANGSGLRLLYKHDKGAMPALSPSWGHINVCH